MTGTSGRQRAQTDVIENTKIMLPPLDEQKAIAHILSTLDDKIEVNNQINKTLENMAQAIFKQWFVDFEFPNEDGEPYKSSGGEMVESELGMIPKGWEVKELVDVLETLEAGNRPKGGAGNLTEGIPSIGAENIIGLGKYDYPPDQALKAMNIVMRQAEKMAGNVYEEVIWSDRVAEEPGKFTTVDERNEE
nr:restriction endonuclease subunit S [Enterococcus faecium]